MGPGAVYGGGRAVAMETRQSRKQLEKEVTTSMLVVRLAEMRYDWLENRDKLVVELPELAAAIRQWLAEAEKLKKAEESLQERHQQLALVKEAEAHAQHALYTLPGRYVAHCAATDATTKTHSALQLRADECARQIQQYKMALGYLYGPQLAQSVAEVSSPNKQDSYLVFDLIKEFLQNAGQGQMVLQCIQSEKELCDLCCQQTQLTRACLDLLGQYGAIVRQFPVSQINLHRTSLYHRWASTLLQSPYIESCEAVLAEMKVALSPPPLAQASVVVGYNMALQRLLADSRAHAKRMLDRASVIEQAGDGEKAMERVADRSPLALQCVIITALCNLNKRFLVMESAAKSTKDCLVDLTSQKGEWFLDDMCLSAGTMVRLLSLLPPPEPGTTLHAAVKCLQAAHNQYKSLQELNLNFSSIILPEAIQTIQREDPTVLTLLAELDSIIASVQMPLGDLVSQLQLHLHLLVTGMGAIPEGCQAAVAVATGLQEAVEAMFQRLGSSDPLSPGQMLLMGFNGLFDNLALGCCGLVSALATLHIPGAWRSVDQLRDAKLLAAPTYDPAPRAVLDRIFLVKRLQAMQELFALSRANSESFKGVGATLPCDDDRLNRPIRCFTADYVSCQLLGVFSHTMAATVCLLLQHVGLNVTGEVEQREVGADSRVPLEDLCRAAVDCCVRQGVVTSATLNQASAAVSAVEVGWRATQLTLRLTQDAQRAELTTQRLQLQLTAHCWLHEDMLAAAQLSPPISE
ncbi:Serine/threonine-protein kinase smg1 [Homalodisca vitripennis]|nr:Serine/threonine-protein kinase smg1 [Homalodisca vitripennis]